MNGGSGFRKRVRCVLVVDDDGDVRELYGGALRSAGFLVKEAACVEAGLHALASVRPDAVVLDRDLPDGDGFEIARSLRQIRPRTQVIAFTAHAERAARSAANDAGCDAFVAKPCPPSRLVEMVRRLLSVDADRERACANAEE